MKSQIKFISSNSGGNCSIISNGGQHIIVDIGVNIMDIKQALNFDISNIKCCVVSHRHGDHINERTAKELNKYGIPIHSNEDVKKHYNFVQVMPENGVQVGDFHIQYVELYHDALCWGYLIKEESIGKLLIAADTGSMPYVFKDLTTICIEVNWDDDSMIDSIIDGKFVQKERLINNHLSFNKAIDFLKRNINAKTRNIVFLHLSNNNSNYHTILLESKKQLSFDNIFIAEKGLNIEINKDLF